MSKTNSEGNSVNRKLLHLTVLMSVFIFLFGVSVGTRFYQPVSPQPDYLTAYLQEHYGVNTIDQLIAKYRQEAFSRVPTQTLGYFSQPFDYRLPATSLEVQPFTEPSYLPAPTVTFNLEPFTYLAVNSLSSFAFVGLLFVGQINKRFKLKMLHILLGSFVLVFLWGVFIGTYMVAPALASSTVTLEPGSFVEIAYVIWTDGTTIYAKDGQTGQTVCKSTNASYVFNTVISKIPSAGELGRGGVIIVKPGNYTIDAPIKMDRNLALIGLSGTDQATVLKLDDGADCSIMIIGKKGDSTGISVHIQGFRFYGNKDKQTTSTNLMEIWNRVRQSTFVDLFFYESKGNHIYVDSDAGVSPQDIWFYHIALEMADDWGMRWKAGGYNLHIINSYGGWCGESAFYLEGGPINVWFSNCWGLDSTPPFIVIYNSKGVHIHDCQIDGAGTGATGPDKSAIYLYQVKHADVHDNIIVSKESPNNTPTYGLYLLNCEDIYIHDNIFRLVTTPIYKSGCSDIKITHNKGYVTENSGTATVGDGEWIAHGLSGTPTTVIITSRSTTYDGVTFVIGVANRNATHFQVRVTWTNGTAITDDAITIDWYAEYQP